MDDKTKFAFLLTALDRMAPYTLQFLASVIGVPSSTEGGHVGSACWCSLGGNRCLVTAKHVIDEARRFPDLADSIGHALVPKILGGEILLDDKADIAIYYPPDDLQLGDNKAYWAEEHTDSTDTSLSTDYLFLHGFPGTSSYPSAHLGGIDNRSLPYGAMRRTENLPPGLSDFQFAINFEPRNMYSHSAERVDSCPDPSGMSGSPVFRIGISGRNPLEWTPEFSRLVGFMTRWDRDLGILIATKVSRVLALAKRETPGFTRRLIER